MKCERPLGIRNVKLNSAVVGGVVLLWLGAGLCFGELVRDGFYEWTRPVRLWSKQFEAQWTGAEAAQVEIRRLEGLLAGYEKNAHETALAQRETAQLRRLLGLQTHRPDLQLLPATLEQVPRGTERLLLDKGREDGTRVGLCVLDAWGRLLGKVVQVDARFCQMLPLQASGFSLGVELLSSGTQGRFCVEGGVCVLEGLPLGLEIPKGEAVQSRSLEHLYPSGLLLGHIEGVYLAEGGLSQTALVRPAVDIHRQNSVYVVLDF